MTKVEVSRTISQPVQLMLWGKAAGRCEFDGCNKPLWQSDITKEQVNIAQKAHIWAFSPAGPRGNSGIIPEDINSISNLMLVCHQCHRLIDQDKDGKQYPVALLEHMKLKHEQRIELATAVPPEKSSHILLYGANVGTQTSPVTYSKAVNAILPNYYPADSSAIKLGLRGSPFEDSSESYWDLEKNVLKEQFDKLVVPRLVHGDISHLSVFAMAPQPLLIFLGGLLTDIPAAEVYQLHREPPTWSWPDSSESIDFKVIEPEGTSTVTALNVSLSASIDNGRIHEVLGDDISIWGLTIDEPHNDFMDSRKNLLQFRAVFRKLLDRIKHKVGHNNNLHIFPAAPVSVAVEMGRIKMPKADMNFSLYDENKSCGGFVYAFDV